MSSSGTGSRQWLSHVRVLVCSPSPQVWLHNDHALQSENSGEGPENIQGKINHFLISYSQSLALQTLVSDKGPESFLQYAVHVRCRVWTPSSQVLLQVDQTLHNENSEGPKENLSRWESHRETISTWIIADRQGLTYNLFHCKHRFGYDLDLLRVNIFLQYNFGLWSLFQLHSFYCTQNILPTSKTLKYLDGRYSHH